MDSDREGFRRDCQLISMRNDRFKANLETTASGWLWPNAGVQTETPPDAAVLAGTRSPAIRDETAGPSPAVSMTRGGGRRSTPHCPISGRRGLPMAQRATAMRRRQ